MKEETTELLNQLAQKLGTTTEYLWSILLKQAPISATLDLIKMLFILFFGLILWKIHKHLMKKEDRDDRYSQTLYDKYEEGARIPMIVAVIIFIILSISCFYSIGNVVNGYFNPEYWALRTILTVI